MGGCATKPRDVNGPNRQRSEDTDAATNPAEAKSVDVKAVEAAATESKAESKEEALIDFSTMPKSDENASPKDAKLVDSLFELKSNEQQQQQQQTVAGEISSTQSTKGTPEKAVEATSADKVTEKKIAEKA